MSELDHGEKSKLWERLPFSKQTGSHLAKVASDERIVQHVVHLPPAWGTLYELTNLDDDAWDRGLAEGVISPKMERKDAKTLAAVSRTSPEPKPIPAGQYGVIYDR